MNLPSRSIINKIVFLSVLYSSSINALTLSCTHSEVCLLLSQMVHESVQVEELIRETKDPHLYDPTIKDIKLLITKKNLITPSINLQPWLQTILAKRKNKTFTFSSFEKQRLQYKISRESWSHFWLNPYIDCLNKKALHLQLKKWNVQLKTPEIQCDNIKNWRELKKLIQKKYKDTLFIISHDGLKALMKWLNLESYYLMSSKHHHEISLKTVKLIVQAAKAAKKIIWLKEEYMQGQEMVKNLIPKAKIKKVFLKRSFSVKMKDDSIFFFLKQLARHE